ncbi:MAG: hypothetical protein FWD69_14405 [Polyangiaceae bacterium]|nr:hypothetical protein [Polyangiaceae bacterium]
MVVTIVGVLAVIAVVSYRKITLSAKVGEATHMVSAIRIAEEDYKTEIGSYANIGANNWCPSDGKQQQKVAWGACATWTTLPVHVDGPLQFGYRVAADINNVQDPFTTGVDFSRANQTVPWYIIQAQADLGNDGYCTQVVGTSFTNQIFTFDGRGCQ